MEKKEQLIKQNQTFTKYKTFTFQFIWNFPSKEKIFYPKLKRLLAIALYTVHLDVTTLDSTRYLPLCCPNASEKNWDIHSKLSIVNYKTKMNILKFITSDITSSFLLQPQKYLTIVGLKLRNLLFYL